MMLTINDNGTIITVPDELLITEEYMAIEENTHFVLSLHPKRNMGHYLKIVLMNGLEPTGSLVLLGKSFLKIKYMKCTLEQYKKMKAFL